MKKRILSILLAVCMVAAMVPAMPTTASAADTCTCPAKCTDSYKDPDCPVCSSGGTCESRRNRRIYDDSTGITTQFHLQAALDWKDAAHYLYYFPLDADITVSSNITVPENADFVLDLNGHTLSGNHVWAIFKVYGKLTIIDTKGGGKLVDAQGAIKIDGGYVLMKGGTIENCTVSGAVLVQSGTFKMTGGTLKNNECYDGLSFEGRYYPGSIYCISNGTVIIDGRAQVLCCDEDNCGHRGAVCMADDTTLYIDGGAIKGGIYNGGTTHSVGGGTITSTHSGEGAVIEGKIINHGTISGGTYSCQVENKRGRETGEPDGSITGGTFRSTVTNTGSISGGTFHSEVDNQGTISDGTYSETGVVQNTGTISGGTFASEVDNQGTISGGTYSETSVVKNTGAISGGTFLGTVETENGTIEDSAKVSVNFVNEAGETMKTVRVLRGQRITTADLPEFDPTQYGYKKLKYTVGNTDYRDEDKFINEVHFTEDETWVTVTRISPIAYTITCNLNGGIGRETYTYTVTDPDFTLHNPTKDGYVFTGWGGTGLEGTSNMTVTIPQGSIGNRTYTANYRKDWSGEIVVPPSIGYTVVFDTQGGSPVDTKTYLFGNSAEPVLEGVSTTRAGYQLQLWTCGGRLVNLDATVSDLKEYAVNGVITLKARWMPKRTISVSIETQEYTYDGIEKAFEIIGTTLDGFNVTYRQNGHTVEAPVNAGSYDVTVTREEDAAFQAVNVTVPGGLVIQPKEVTVTIDAIPEQTYTGNVMKPAITVSDGTNEIPASEYTVDYTNNSNAGTATVTVTDKAGGNYIFPQITQNFTIKQKSINPAVTMADYVYGTYPGYPEVSGNEGGGTVSVYYSTGIDNGTSDTIWQPWNESLTLNAGTYYMMVTVAETQNYTAGISPVITFQVMSAKYDPPAAPTLDGSTVTINKEYWVKTLEYSLNGGDWVDVPALNNGSFVPAGLGENTGYTLSLRVKASTDGNYAASDAVDCFFMAYNANGGTGTVPSGASASSGNSVTVASGDQLRRDGYTFGGWNTETDGTGTAYAAGSSVTTGATLYAQWTANRYTVTFDTDGGTEIAPKTTVQWTDTVLDGITNPTKNGWKFIGWKYGDVPVTPQTTYRELAVEGSVLRIELKAQWEDIEKPVITGLENGKTYCAPVEFEASDHDGIASVRAGNKVLTADSNGKYTLAAGVGTVTVVVTDKAGNETSVTVTVHHGHTYEWQSANGQYWKKCKFCGDETAKKDIPTITINGADAVCVTQDYTFSFTLPEGATDAVYGYAFENKGDDSLKPTMENGKMVAVISAGVYEPNEGSFKIIAQAKTADGFEIFASKTVALGSEHTDTAPKDHLCDVCGTTLSQHSGGTATCKDRAVCDYCGNEYGEVDSDKHTGGTEIRDAKAATCTAEGYTGDTCCVGCGEKLSAGASIPKVSHTDNHKDHLCDVCGATLSEHTGGTVTCTEKAVCDYCGKRYGEPKGHSYKETVVQPSKYELGGTKHICENCDDQYWTDFTTEDTCTETLMPSGETIHHYCTNNGLEADTTVDVGDNVVLRVFLQDPLGALKRMEDDGIKIYKITEGAEQVVVPSEEKEIVFRSDAPFKEFHQVMLNGLVLDKKYYSVKEGSTVVTLNADFAEELKEGMHLFGILSTDGIAITTFTIETKAAADNDTNAPQTGDNSHMALWIALPFVSGGLLSIMGVYVRKKKHTAR